LRDYVHVLDIADAHCLALKLMNEPRFEVYNIGTGVSYSVLQMCHQVEEITGLKPTVRFGERRPGDPAILCASPQKIHAQLGWKPKSSDLRQILSSAWKWESSRSSRMQNAPAFAKTT
jgi:UDP-glucose 4-epimerase